MAVPPGRDAQPGPGIRKVDGGWVSVSSLSARPSPIYGRVGIHDFTFGACSSFPRVMACQVACPPKDGLLSRAFSLTKPLGSYHALPTTTEWDLPSIGDLRVGPHN